MGEERLVEEPYDLVHVRATSWAGGTALTPALVRLDFHFWGLAIPLEAARARRRALDRHGVSVILVPARYRTAAITREEAGARAGEVVREHRLANPERDLEAPRLDAEHPAFYRFLAASSELRRQGRIPPGLLVSIDRADGHLWADEEMALYHRLTAR